MKNVNPGESAYLALLRRVLETGSRVPTRNGDRYTLLNETLKFSLVNGELPLMTTRQLPFHLIDLELRWFLSGSTNVKMLRQNNCHLWDKWALSQEDADKECARVANVPADSADYRKAVQAMVGTIGPMYGATWCSNLGRKPPYETDNQLTRLVRELKAHPYSTQHVLTTYNPSVKMDETQSCAENILNGYGALTPCHGLHTQFTCLPPRLSGGKPRLHCLFTNRSQDLPVGTVFNIAMYAVLTHLIAHICGFEAAELTWVGAHCHIYPNQIAAVKELLRRAPGAFPQLHINPAVKSLDDVVRGNASLTLVNYIAYPVMRIPVTG